MEAIFIIVLIFILSIACFFVYIIKEDNKQLTPEQTLMKETYEFAPYFPIVGNSHHNSPYAAWTKGELIPDSRNQYDKFAVKVFDDRKRQIGWIPQGNEYVHKTLADGLHIPGFIEKRTFTNELGDIKTTLRFHIDKEVFPKEVFKEIKSNGLEPVLHW